MPLGPRNAVEALLESMLDVDYFIGVVSLFVLLLYGALGMLVTTLRVRREMIP